MSPSHLCLIEGIFSKKCCIGNQVSNFCLPHISLISSFLSFYHFSSRRLHMSCGTNNANDIQKLYFPFFVSLSLFFSSQHFCTAVYKFLDHPFQLVGQLYPIWIQNVSLIVHFSFLPFSCARLHI